MAYQSLLPLAAILVAGSALAAAPKTSAPVPSPAMVAAGHAAFAPCSGCHAVVASKNGLGPSLFAIIGRPVASAPAFAYSPALKARKGVWTRDRIDAFIAAPQQSVPGTMMAYPGQPDAAKRAAITAYLATLK